MADPGQGTRGARPHEVGRELLEALFYGLNAGVFVVDMDARIAMVNPRAEELLKRRAADMIGHDSHVMLHRQQDGAEMPRTDCPLVASLTVGSTSRAEIAWFERGDGSLLPVGWLTAPYDVNGSTAGAVVLFFDQSRQDAAEQRREAHLAALQGLTDRLSLVAETTAVLTSTLDVDEALYRLVRLVVPRMADWAVVDLLDERDELRRVAVVRYEDGAYVNMRQFEGPLPPVPESSRMPLSRVLRGASTTLVRSEDHDALPDSPVTVVQRDLFEATGMHSAVIAPLHGLRGVLGALTVGRRDQRPAFDASEVTLIDDIARRAGLAVDNTQLYEQQRRVAENMQRHLLPPLPDVRGLEMAARYLPAPHGSQVGGDWYDAFPLPDGATVLAIGDVVGHDLQAAASMSQVRNMLRAFTWDRREPPSLIIDRLDSALVHMSDAPMASLVLARVEGPTGGPWQLHWANAGHPPPLLVGQDGRTRFLDAGHGVLLGTEVDAERTDAIVPLPPLTTVVLYTDGLIESPNLSIDDGLERLRRHASSLVSRSLDDFCDQLIENVLPSGTDDDIAVLALRVPQLSEH